MKALPRYLSPYIEQLILRTGGMDGPIGKQFIPSTLENSSKKTENDPQEEYIYEAAPGLIYKYKGQMKEDGTAESYGRALWTISRYCATYCRFCFRGRFVGLEANRPGFTSETLSNKPFLNDEDIVIVQEFLRSHREINEVILSGGDPLVTPAIYFNKIIEMLVGLQKNGDLDVIRIHTRAPITNPYHIKEHHLESIAKIRNPYIVLHINHPAELTDEVLTVADRLRKECGALLLSQSVLLKGINDSVDILQELFVKITNNGIRPYYLHQNDPVSWAEHFTVPLPRAISIWRELRTRLSGLAASAKFVIDTPHGKGKVVVPESEWNQDYSEFVDFDGQIYSVE